MRKHFLFLVFGVITMSVFFSCQKEEIRSYNNRALNAILADTPPPEEFYATDTLDSGIVHTHGYHIYDEDCNLIETIIISVYVEKTNNENHYYHKEDDGWFDENNNLVFLGEFWWYDQLRSVLMDRFGPDINF